MGAKITVDSASMMNKGLEVMEAHWLFNLPISQVKVVIHPQSVVHSMVEFVDGSVMAQMGEPDMRVPIAYALSYPRRISTNVKSLSLPAREKLTFYEPDLQKFRCLKIAFDVARSGRSYAPVLNAANEIAVDGFLTDKIGFVQISELIDRCIQKHEPHDLRTIEDVLAADQWARSFVNELVLRETFKNYPSASLPEKFQPSRTIRSTLRS
jgi:1-deoxy-D-xylulose-5-phosphate reductoisomerase